jgi:hypothetical protein
MINYLVKPHFHDEYCDLMLKKFVGIRDDYPEIYRHIIQKVFDSPVDGVVSSIEETIAAFRHGWLNREAIPTVSSLDEFERILTKTEINAGIAETKLLLARFSQ